MWEIANELAEVAKIAGVDVTINHENMTAQLVRKVIGNFAENVNNDYLWQSVSDSLSTCNNEAWAWIGELIPRAECIMFFNPSDEKLSITFRNGRDAVLVLAETYGFEFYLTNESTDYLLCFNHHNVLMACGYAKDWLERLLKAQ